MEKKKKSKLVKGIYLWCISLVDKAAWLLVNLHFMLINLFSFLSIKKHFCERIFFFIYSDEQRSTVAVLLCRLEQILRVEKTDSSIYKWVSYEWFLLWRSTWIFFKYDPDGGLLHYWNEFAVLPKIVLLHTLFWSKKYWSS